jgi:hypothetical protein
MKLIKSIIFASAVMLIAASLGCGTKKISEADVKSYADPAAENLMQAFNDENYDNFSRDFDKVMKEKLTEASFKQMITQMKPLIGNYVSMNFYQAVSQDKYVVVVYKAKFTKETSDVYVKVTFQKLNDKEYVSGLFFDSPKLRAK